MKYVTTTIRVEDDLFDFIKENKINLSEKVNILLREKFFNIESRKREVERIEKELVKMKEDIKKEEEKQKQRICFLKDKINNERREELLTSKNVLKERGNIYFQGRFNRYKNLYDECISVEEFRLLLDIV